MFFNIIRGISKEKNTSKAESKLIFEPPNKTNRAEGKIIQYCKDD